MKRKGFYQVFCTLVCLTVGAASYAASNVRVGDPVADAAQEAQAIRDERPVSVSIILKFSSKIYANQPAARISVKRAVAGEESVNLYGTYNRFLQRVVDFLKANLDQLAEAEAAEHQDA